MTKISGSIPADAIEKGKANMIIWKIWFANSKVSLV